MTKWAPEELREWNLKQQGYSPGQIKKLLGSPTYSREDMRKFLGLDAAEPEPPAENDGKVWVKIKDRFLRTTPEQHKRILALKPDELDRFIGLLPDDALVSMTGEASAAKAAESVSSVPTVQNPFVVEVTVENGRTYTKFSDGKVYLVDDVTRTATIVKGPDAQAVWRDDMSPLEHLHHAAEIYRNRHGR